MDNSPQFTESLISVGTEPDHISRQSMLTDDQYFLLYFIMGTFFGPDLSGESPQKSVLQRLAVGLPSYTTEQLAGSYIKTVDVERIYYYVLRNADQSLVVKLSLLHKFFHGNILTPAKYPAAAYPQFPDLFPPQLHPHSRFKTRYKIIENIVFVNNPEIFYIKPEYIERFKRLSGLESFLLDRDGPRLHFCVNDAVLSNVATQEFESKGELPPQMSSHGTQVTEISNDCLQKQDSNSQNDHAVKPVSSVPSNVTPMSYGYMSQLPAQVDTSIVERFEPGMIFLPSPPTREEWGNIVTATRSGSAITGTAAMGHIGQATGLLDIGECEDSYLFRVSLPGVKRDEREFGCEVENDGKVLIRGVTTTGEKTIYRHSQVFEMQTQNLSPSGHFSISFKLPGPVDPQQFSGNFGTDGILEGFVMKGIKEENS
ncbi:increased DNA methylation 2-like [Actinidia eriantha]|uniref:increased DNA methylation 2-like n=1 Tax=Actinidia eriantha TaxID=165200 RepID=UPI0025883C52|nr:increased DNA methylation 2-like [Actinidia eriantha]XP_057502779.1 increased DNA methylation 2-like [Actinidia eriantha]XP_057502780.1 increased DNA methylation 2-like [Actinidia eriantha]XP_057502781.1 increased DNA methylation 2-like [Actinidia eriantha]XP_057502782.1 increased DNA methylation 2-like [Actinidia eriantha]XP_057502783.1 increased DNA methylation 2-like [Actinidia eriantha]